MMKINLIPLVNVFLVFLIIFLYSCNSDQFKNSSNNTKYQYRVSNNFGKPLGRDLDNDGNKDSAVILNNISGGYLNDLGKSIWVDSKGKVYIAGYSFNGSNYNIIIARLNSNGNLDKTFSSDGYVILHDIAFGNGDDYSNSIYVDPNGNIYITGVSWNGSDDDLIVTKLNSDGTLDTSFGYNGHVVLHNIAGGNRDDYGTSIYVNPNGNIYITGVSWNGSDDDLIVTKLNSDGTLDTSFGYKGHVVLHNIAKGGKGDIGNSIYVDEKGRVYVTGSSYGKDYDLIVTRLNSNGTLDKTFDSDGHVILDNIAGGDGYDNGYSVYVDQNDKIYVTGYSSNSSDLDLIVTRLNSDGTLDKTFDSDGCVVLNNIVVGNKHEIGFSIYVDKKGKVYVTGGVNSGEEHDLIVTKLNSDGTLDKTFDSDGHVVLHNIAVENKQDYGNPIWFLSEYDRGNSIYVDSNGKVYVTGESTARRSGLVVTRLKSNGIIDTTFGYGGHVILHDISGGKGDNIGTSIYVDKKGNVYVTGVSLGNRKNYDFLRIEKNYDLIVTKLNSNGDIDTTFGSNGYVILNNITGKNKNYIGCSIYVDSNGKVYVAGYSHNFSRYSLIRYSLIVIKLNSDGSLDKTFDSDGHVVIHKITRKNRHVQGKSIYVDSKGNIYVTGVSFNSLKPEASDADLIVTKLNSDGTLDTTFDSDGHAIIHNIAGGNKNDHGFSICVDPNGKIYVTGYSDGNGTNKDLIVTRLNSNGTLDKTFDSDGHVVLHNIAGGNGEDVGNSICVDSNGNVYVTGYSHGNGTDEDLIVTKLKINGTLDKSFGSSGHIILHNIAGGNGNDCGNSIYVDPNGKIYVTGYSDGNGTNKDLIVTKLNSNGTLDKTFSYDGHAVFNNIANENGKSFSHDEGNSIYVDQNGKIYVTGNTKRNIKNKCLIVTRLNSNGTLDRTFSSDGHAVFDNTSGSNGNSVYVDQNGKVYITGSSWNDSDLDLIVTRLNSDGTLDKTFDSDGCVVLNNIVVGNKHEIGFSIYVDKKGKVYVTGGVSSGEEHDLIVIRLNSNGTLDRTFSSDGYAVFDNIAGGNGNDESDSVYVDQNGKVYITGSSWNGSDLDLIVTRLNSDGTLDKTFDSDGHVVLHNIAGGNGNDGGKSIYVDSKGNVYVTGYSDGNDKYPKLIVTKLNSNGTLDKTFGSNGHFIPHNITGKKLANKNFFDIGIGTSIHVDSNSKVYITGLILNLNKLDFDLIVIKLNSDGTLDRSFNPEGHIILDNIAGGNKNDFGKSICVDSNGKIYITGYSDGNMTGHDLIVVKIE